MAKHKKNRGTGELTHYTRWATWERDVLSKVVDPAGIQQLVRKRQREIDDDATEMEAVRTYFRERIAAWRNDPDKVCIFLPNPAAQIWLEEAAGERHPTNKASTKLETLGIPELSKALKKEKTGNRQVQRRGWRWKGLKAPKTVEMEDYPFAVSRKKER
jgi:hypothetical protein